MIFDRLHDGYGNFLVANAKKQRRNKKLNEIALQVYHTGDYTDHDQLIPMQFSVSTI